MKRRDLIKKSGTAIGSLGFIGLASGSAAAYCSHIDTVMLKPGETLWEYPLTGSADRLKITVYSEYGSSTLKLWPDTYPGRNWTDPDREYDVYYDTASYTEDSENCSVLFESDDSNARAEVRREDC